MLPNDLLMVITKKIAACGTQDLLNFGATSKLHHQLGNKQGSIQGVEPRLFLVHCRSHFIPR